MPTDEEVVRVHQAGAGGDDAVPVSVRVVAERDIEPVAQLHEPAIAYGDDGSIRMRPSQSTVMKPNCGSTVVVGDRQVEPVALGDSRPVVDLAPPIGSTPRRRPDDAMASMSMTGRGR